MFRNHTREGFSLIELVLCIGLLLIALPLLWMIISLITAHTLRMAVQTERDKAVYVLVMVLDRCVSIAEQISVAPHSISTSAGSVRCLFQSDAQTGTSLFINEGERIFSGYQSKITFSVERDEGSPRRVSAIFKDQTRNVFTYTFYEE